MSAEDGFPASVEALRESRLLNSWWYYSVELMPGVVAAGQYPDSIPMLPRVMMRRCDLRGASCLDIGAMEGLMSALMVRGGASRVLAVDAVDHCQEKMAAVQHYHHTPFEYRSVGPMYGLAEKLEGEGFDFINCSGLLYHVVSPLTVLMGLRPALKRNGLMLVSTNVVVDAEPVADFNAAGKLQVEPNTFWYLSTGLLDYFLRYLRLAPIGVTYQPHDTMATEWRMQTGKSSGYASILCRAAEEIVPEPGDEWMADSAARSWEYEWLVDWEQVERQGRSRIRARDDRGAVQRDLGAGLWDRLLRRAPRSIDLTRTIERQPPVTEAGRPADSHLLGLADRT